MGGLLGIAVQTRIGAAIDETRAKRGAIVLSLDVLACSAMVLFILPRFWPATGGVRRIRNTTNQKSGIESGKNRVPTETSMASYALWNNKDGVGKSYLTFQIACEYAITHPNKNVLVLDLCPQANSSIMLLGGMDGGETHLDEIAKVAPKRTIAGYIEDRLRSPYVSPRTGATYLTRPAAINKFVPQNVFLVAGDEDLEIQSSRVSKFPATRLDGRARRAPARVRPEVQSGRRCPCRRGSTR